MIIKQPLILQVTKCSRCGDEVELTQYAASLGKRDVMCRDCMRMPIPKYTKATYQDYLKTEYWQQRRKRALERAGYRCQVCASTENLEVHHNCYDRLEHELDFDLFVMCRKHHQLYEDNK